MPGELRAHHTDSPAVQGAPAPSAQRRISPAGVIRRLAGHVSLVSGVLCMVSAAVAADAVATATQTLKVNDTASLHLVRSNANTRTQAGHASGTLPGNATVTITQSGSKITGDEVIQVRGGTLTLRGSGTLHIGEGVYASFSGSSVVTGGTGRYKGASGSGNFYGAENRFTHSATIQSVGTVRY